jgi:hypothetical protein
MRRYCKLLKEWGGFPVGHELWIGEPKAEHLQIRKILEFIDPPGKKAVVETATAEPKAETAEVTPVNPPKRRGRRKVN